MVLIRSRTFIEYSSFIYLFQAPQLQILPSCNKYCAPERFNPSKSSSWAASWDVSFGRFYNGAFPAMENLVKLGDIAKTLQQMFEACVAANPAKRPNPSGQDEEGKSRLHNNEINYVFM